MTTGLEHLYYTGPDRSEVANIGDNIKAQLVAEGRDYIHDLLLEGNTDEGDDQAFDLLAALAKLRDLRTAARHYDIPSRYADFDRLRQSLA